LRPHEATSRRFIALSFGCVIGLALAMGFALSSVLTDAVERWEWENTGALTQRQVQLSGLETLFTARQDAAARERWQREFARLFAGFPEVVRVKVWDRQATVLWSDEARLIGRRFPDNAPLRTALGGTVSVAVKPMAGREHAYERTGASVLAEVYVPIFASATGELLGVVEVDKTPARLRATVRWGRILIWAISLAGVAHELNNPLAAITGYTELLLRDTAPSDPGTVRLERINQAATRCARIVRNFLALVRRHPPERQEVWLNQIVEDAVELVAYSLRVDGVELQLDLALDLPVIAADPHPLQQVFSDVRMPELDGPRPYRVLARRQPEVLRRIVFVTGDTVNPATRQFLSGTGVPSLAKPFAPDDVRRLVQEITAARLGAEEVGALPLASIG
jgi:signal transduction histidine kinase